ncbi:mannose-6-phosphate isomerase [Cylas formicarius]|uniref:mannose-6-phosphate isomerase n=1 Tax=Cylas formicarius TaxID=197179 RepID=UPI002958BBA7|nr:mannose-6-phosphate isomerase [Cylas formicarius]XP_060531234.1 mannose-6-phosphate isomerase [Cylas formicarius]XP_060531235.1 mannose-6-phosphate isomerase [Cylas formicarius]XP_060531236.1 mannose-6-phosphate isomerase [Cylas formicarius]XP_060531237.1 mannose-6-phosphate isomerase [Cylas formicarius]
MELICKVQNYEWGKVGLDSAVAKLQRNANPEFPFDETVPYAEMWMGTHVNGPSLVKHNSQELGEIIAKHPEYLGDEVLRRFNGELPFLFKVLSVNKALSIQAHPSKKHAEELHHKFPKIYKDPNHKPEMAIALTEFEALCGFRRQEEIKRFVEEIPQLKVIVSCADEDESEYIKNAFKAVLTSQQSITEKLINDLLHHLKKSTKDRRNFLCAELVERLHQQFPYDVGILMVYFLNYLKLKPSEAIFLGANVPHAYLFGDCIECMACSDNVVRAGLTPKFIDVETLCSMLIYKGEKAESKLFAPVQEDKFSVIFKPPVPDFAVVRIEVPKSEFSFTPAKRDCASILLVISGQAQYQSSRVGSGTTLFIPASETAKFTGIIEDMLIYQAVANV